MTTNNRTIQLPFIFSYLHLKDMLQSL